ncbi:MAG: hypothetical protein AAF702_50945 [Chloroflexota bacterium]
MAREEKTPIIYLLAMATICLLMISARQKANAQSMDCLNGTLPNACTYLPVMVSLGEEIPPAVYNAIPVDGPAIDRPPAEHGDLNLALRGYQAVTATLALININGPTDSDAPQLDGLFAEPRLPNFTETYQVHDWDWMCGENGCRGEPLTQRQVTLLGIEAAPGEPIHIPSRNPEIYSSGYKALVLYAEAERITLVYTRQDTAAFGYVAHLEDVEVDPSLLALYQELDAAGRDQLPALRNGERLGYAGSTTLKVAIRDTGTFMDPRSQKDWWMDY